MKTIRQQLQSRISLRRNDIKMKEFMYSHMKSAGYYEAAAIYRRDANVLAKEQRLDKELYAMVLEQERSPYCYDYPGVFGFYDVSDMHGTTTTYGVA